MSDMDHLISPWFLHMLVIFSSSRFRRYRTFTLNSRTYCLLFSFFSKGRFLLSFGGFPKWGLSPHFCCLSLALGSLLGTQGVEAPSGEMIWHLLDQMLGLPWVAHLNCLLSCTSFSPGSGPSVVQILTVGRGVCIVHLVCNFLWWPRALWHAIHSVTLAPKTGWRLRNPWQCTCSMVLWSVAGHTRLNQQLWPGPGVEHGLVDSSTIWIEKACPSTCFYMLGMEPGLMGWLWVLIFSFHVYVS